MRKWDRGWPLPLPVPTPTSLLKGLQLVRGVGCANLWASVRFPNELKWRFEGISVSVFFLITKFPGQATRIQWMEGQESIMDGCFKTRKKHFSSIFWIFILKYCQKHQVLGFAFVFLPMLHNFFFLSFLAFAYFATGTWRERERERENRLKMKETRGSQFQCETENTAKILYRAFIFRHRKFTES